MRVFAAIELAETVRQELAGAAAELRERLPGVRWTRPENLHLTLRFLGEIEQSDAGHAHEALAAAASTIRPIELRFGTPAVFPDARRPSVLVVELTGEDAALDALRGLVSRFESSLRELCYPPERRAFRPHVTIGRVRRKRSRSEKTPTGQALLEALGGTSWPHEDLPVNEVVLFESILAPGGAIYTPLVRCTLDG